MKKTIIAITAAAFLGAGAFSPVPALAETPKGFVPLPVLPMVLVMSAKEDKNFKAVNPYAPKKVSKRKRKM